MPKLYIPISYQYQEISLYTRQTNTEEGWKIRNESQPVKYDASEVVIHSEDRTVIGDKVASLHQSFRRKLSMSFIFTELYWSNQGEYW